MPFYVSASYKDLVCCDVILIDACHLLLGCLWQYDRHTSHDGFGNMYSFSFENKRITLLPTKDTTTPVISSIDLPAHPITTSLGKPVLLSLSPNLLKNFVWPMWFLL